jgi:hypothetical protein
MIAVEEIDRRGIADTLCGEQMLRLFLVSGKG